MAASHETTGSRLMARALALLLLLLAAQAAPAQARSTPENRTGEKTAQNAELSFSPTPQTLELQRENATAQRYDVSGDSFAAEAALAMRLRLACVTRKSIQAYGCVFHLTLQGGFPYTDSGQKKF